MTVHAHRAGCGGGRLGGAKRWGGGGVHGFEPVSKSPSISAFTHLTETYRYQELAPATKALRSKGLSSVKICKKLKISDKTAQKSVLDG